MKFYEAPTYSKEQLAELEEEKIQFPFNDDDATYNSLYHQYELTSKYFEERGRNLQKELSGQNGDKVKLFLSALRTKVYTYIYTHNKSTRNQLNYMIAKRGLRGYTPYEYRQAFLEAMFIEGCYLLDNGDISNVTGIDLDTMQNMSQDVIRRQERDYHKDFIGIMKQLGLNYYGNYTFIPQGRDW
jgi:hypothetical protein